MSKSIDFYFDVGSPASYLAWTQLPALAENHQAQLNYKPMLLGAVFQATGNSSPGTVAAKGNYTRQDFQRFAKRYGVALKHNPHFPINTLMLMRGATAYLHTADFERYLEAIFRAMWVEELDMGKPEVVAGVLHKAGFDGAEVMTRVQDPAVKDQLKATTAEAIERGVFGAPTLFVGENMFFGQDRLDFVAEALANED
ncbi:2-hydroxychromene-2-carboxylate isomerase [Halopseudomonas salegens]|uniref:2-hydroxychromene-2-carboxylate isomerase n=1 Tax=Halopseudomonas salegens TaxID=1434072 RepID=A0A1H2H8L5_9GAMM|nr:2-hydroxychromene-2-carboxylate isomerase [Halopseudomonas salegens]SDU28221.1 2-hydroxychromene-2-carboxylate isomerase [Halopseudomonas salegens]